MQISQHFADNYLIDVFQKHSILMVRIHFWRINPRHEKALFDRLLIPTVHIANWHALVFYHSGNVGSVKGFGMLIKDPGVLGDTAVPTHLIQHAHKRNSRYFDLAVANNFFLLGFGAFEAVDGAAKLSKRS